MTMASPAVFDFAPFDVFDRPFFYALSARAFDGDFVDQLLSWLETAAPWRLVETDFYEQFEFSFVDAELPQNIAALKERPLMDVLAAKAESLFGVKLSSRVDATAHRLVSGQRIRIHNDYIPAGETHRILIQLNRGWEDADGGFLLFFNSANPRDVHRVLPPFNNTAVAFAISPDSHHAVSVVNGGVRYTLVYSFYAEQ
jgi:Rps23 Pro-64 3,4-dihydroxylase Tpa1-like proline 4-hydroxylase